MIASIARRASAAALIIAVALAANPASALEFGPHKAFTLRGRFYTQYTIATERSKPESNGTALEPAGAVPSRNPGDMVQHRNFMNPEFEVDFRRLVRPLKGFFDELEGRVALWGFYDGIYDYGPERWRQVLAAFDDHRLQQNSKGTKIALVEGGTSPSGHVVVFPAGIYARKSRRVYGRRIRVNEAYVDLSHGPWFLRVGRQAISWGEADTIGLLDANNPFDITLQPGLLIDIDEARIPLWTIRGTYELFDAIGPFSSGFLEAYWVPGWLDTTISSPPIQSGSPFAQPPPANPGYASTGFVQTINIFNQLPEPSLANSRWGVKLQTVINRDYNLQTWIYTAFPIAPVPVLYGVDRNRQVVSALKNKLTNVIGGALSWYSDTLNSIVRAEVELFNGEPGFLAFKNIGQAIQSGFKKTGHYDRINILRGELGLDYNFFVPALNPSSSFLMIGSVVWFWNTDETSSKDYRANGILKPSAIRRGQRPGQIPAGFFAGRYCDNPNDPTIPESQRRCDFVNQDPVGGFAQVTLRSDFRHGTLTPQITTIATHRGSLTITPSLVYRFTDHFLFDVKYVNTHTFGSLNNGFSIGPGLLRDRDQFWIRATYQLN